MNYVAETALAAIKRERPDLAGWCEDKRHALADSDKLEVLCWIVFKLDASNREIAARALCVRAEDLEPQGPLGRVLRTI